MSVKPITLFLLFAGYVLCTADKCESVDEANTRKQETLHARLDTIAQNLQSKELTVSARIAFEQKARQKLSDYADYLTLFSDRSLDARFRETVWQLLNTLYADTATILTIRTDSSGLSQSIALNTLPEIIPAQGFEAIMLRIGSVKVAEPLLARDQAGPQGRLEYDQQWYGVSHDDTISLGSTVAQSLFYAKKIEKQIGNTSVMTWQVFLGDTE